MLLLANNMHGNDCVYNSITRYIPDIVIPHPTHELASDVGTTNERTDSQWKQSAPRNVLSSSLPYIYVLPSHYHLHD